MKNKNGFTLIELLAVIVVLAIVTVIATQSILPYMSNARPDAFGIEATYVMKSAEDAATLHNLNKVKLKNNTASCKKDKVLCFTIAELINLGLYDGDSETYKGKVLIDFSNTEVDYTLYLQKGAEFSIVGSHETDFVNNKTDLVSGGFANDKVTEYTTCTCE